MASQVAKAARRATHELRGVVVSAGLMQKTVKVRVGGQKWNNVVKKVSLKPMADQYMFGHGLRHPVLSSHLRLTMTSPVVRRSKASSCPRSKLFSSDG